MLSVGNTQRATSACSAARAQYALESTPEKSRPCFFLYDVHVAKNGGSSMGLLMQRMEERGLCLYWGKSQPPYRWTNAMQAIREIYAFVDTERRQLNATSSQPVRLCIEAHGEDQHVRRLAELGKLQKELSNRGVQCKLARILRVAPPLQHYLAFYSQFITDGKRGRPTRAEGIARLRIGHDFLQWANRTPNLQANSLLMKRERTTLETPSAVGRARLASVLAHIDVLAPLDQFEHALLLAARALQLNPDDLWHHRVRPECLGATRANPVDLSDEAECRALEKAVSSCALRQSRCAAELQGDCEALVEQVAPLDVHLYRLAVDASRRAEQRELWLAEAVASFANRSVGIWRGGPPQRTRCKAVRNRTLARLSWQAFGGQAEGEAGALQPCLRGIRPELVMAIKSWWREYALVPTDRDGGASANRFTALQAEDLTPDRETHGAIGVKRRSS